jgi:predicted phosphoribosyltransferase
MFQNRTEAGIILADRLSKYSNIPALLLAVPRGGVPVAYEIAMEYNWLMEVVLTKKLGHPKNKEYAIGAVGLYDSIVVPHEDVRQEYIEEETRIVRERLIEMHKKFMLNREPQSIQNKTVIVVDDGIATGITLLGTIKILRKQHPARIIIAAPVASQSAMHKLTKEADEVIVELVPEKFFGVGNFFRDFRQVSDEEVIYYLKKAHLAYNGEL